MMDECCDNRGSMMMAGMAELQARREALSQALIAAQGQENPRETVKKGPRCSSSF